MKRWINVLTISLIALSVSVPAFSAPAAAQAGQAQAAKPGKGKGRAGGGFKRLDDALAKLNLTAEQKPKVDAAIKAAKEDAKKIRDAGGTPEENRPKMREVQKTLREKLAAILTPEQQKQFKEATARKKDGAGAAGAAKPAKPAK
jgi:Spy/CpxP family protein refolding chaperone